MPPSVGSHEVQIANRQKTLTIDRRLIRRAVQAVLTSERIESAVISVAIVDDPTIHQLNRRWLDHDCPTDVISFVLERENGHLEGEVIASADTAKSVARRLGLDARAELLRYIVHGTLHLAGYDDQTRQGAAKMRRRQEELLEKLNSDAQSASGGR